MSWPNSLSGGGVRIPTCTCGRRRRALAAGVKRLMNRGFLCTALSGSFRFDLRSEMGTAEFCVAGGGFADVACL